MCVLEGKKVLICTVYLTVCSYHAAYAFQSESTIYSYLMSRNSLLETYAKSEVYFKKSAQKMSFYLKEFWELPLYHQLLLSLMKVVMVKTCFLWPWLKKGLNEKDNSRIRQPEGKSCDHGKVMQKRLRALAKNWDWQKKPGRRQTILFKRTVLNNDCIHVKFWSSMILIILSCWLSHNLMFLFLNAVLPNIVFWTMLKCLGLNILKTTGPIIMKFSIFPG